MDDNKTPEEKPKPDDGDKDDELHDKFLDMVAGGLVAIPMRQRKDLSYW